MSIITELKFRVNLDENLPQSPLEHALMAGDQLAHSFRIKCYRHHFRESVDLTGALVHGYFIRNEKETLLLEGCIEENTAVLPLPAACYATEGTYSLVIKLRLNQVVHTVFWCQGKVVRSSTDALIDPGQVLPTLDQLLAQIDLMEQTTAKAEAVANLTAQAVTLPADSAATAEYKDGKLTLGIPKGRDSDTPLPPGYKPCQMLAISPQGMPVWEYLTHYDHSGGTVLAPTELKVVGGFTTFTSPFENIPVAGTPYRVTYLTYGYNCTAKTATVDGKECVIIGNQSQLGTGLNTQEPFVFVFYKPEDVTNGVYGWFSCMATDKPTIPAAIEGAGELKKIDKKFLPDDIGGGGMPQGGEPYKQLVTDGEGNAMWEDRLAYEDPNAVTAILPETTLLSMDGQFAHTQPLGTALAEGETYIVNYNGASYACVAAGGLDDIMAVPGVVGLGNVGVITGTGATSEPFLIVVVPDSVAAQIGMSVACMSLDGASSVTLSISAQVIKKIDPRYLPPIPKETPPMKLYIKGEPALADGGTWDVYQDADCTTKCSGADYRELMNGRPFVVCLYHSPYVNFLECTPVSQVFMPAGADGGSGYNDIVVILSYVNSYKAKTVVVYLRFEY